MQYQHSRQCFLAKTEFFSRTMPQSTQQGWHRVSSPKPRSGLLHGRPTVPISTQLRTCDQSCKKTCASALLLPSSLGQLKRMVQEEWDALPENLLHNLVESMPCRVNAVIEANEDPTPY